MFQQRGIDFIGDRIALAEDPGDLSCLPINDARQDQVQAAAGVHLFPQLAGVDPAAPPVKDTCRAAQNLPRSALELVAGKHYRERRGMKRRFLSV